MKENKVTCVDGTITIDFYDWYYGRHSAACEDHLREKIEPLLDDFVAQIGKIAEVDDYKMNMSYTYSYEEG